MLSPINAGKFPTILNIVSQLSGNFWYLPILEHVGVLFWKRGEYIYHIKKSTNDMILIN